MEEKVPVVMPMIMARAKSRSTAPPKRYRAVTVNRVMSEVSMVRESVWFTALLMRLSRGMPLSECRRSRMRS